MVCGKYEDDGNLWMIDRLYIYFVVHVVSCSFCYTPYDVVIIIAYLPVSPAIMRPNKEGWWCFLNREIAMMGYQER